eukprot:5593509-Pyramimonas_sp.AAC.3
MWGEDGLASDIMGTYRVGLRDVLDAWGAQGSELPPKGPVEIFLRVGSLVCTVGLFLFSLGAVLLTTAVPAVLFVSSTGIYIGLFGIGVAMSTLCKFLLSHKMLAPLAGARNTRDSHLRQERPVLRFFVHRLRA